MYKKNVVILKILFLIVFSRLALNCSGDDCYVAITKVCDDNPPDGQCQEDCFFGGDNCGLAALLSNIDTYEFVTPHEVGQGKGGYEEGQRVHCGDWFECRCRLQGLNVFKCKRTLNFVAGYSVGTLTPVGDECINVIVEDIVIASQP